MKTKLGEQFDNLVFGIQNDATDYLDRELDEQELFPGHPPSGLHAVFVIYDSKQNENVWSYLDLKSFPEQDTGYKYYRVDVQYHVGDNLIFEWRPFGDEIREAWINDIITGEVVKINMKDSTSALVDNQFIKKFDIKVKYESNTSVEEQEIEDILIYPNPSGDWIKITGKEEIMSYEIFNALGRELISDIINNKQFTSDVRILPTGIYFIKLNFINNKTLIRKIIKY